jgi:glycosyltransferase involved in cell wall biosynthesis
VLELMGKAFLYIGNSTSDGMPNTLLEAIVMGAFPIQSNPGGVTAEIIEHGKNGLLIEDAEDIEALQKLIEAAVNDKQRWQIAYEMNMKIAVERLDFEVNRQKIIAIYETAKISYELD